ILRALGSLVGRKEKIVGGFERGENLLAAVAAREVLLEREHLVGRKQPLVISRQNLGIRMGRRRLGVAGRMGAGPAGAEVALEGFLKQGIAVVRRHGRLPG